MIQCDTVYYKFLYIIYHILHTTTTSSVLPSQSQCNVVRREAVAVLTVGTLTDPEMLVKQPNASYFACIVELPLPEGPVYLATAVGANKSNNNNNNKYNDNNNNNNNDDDGTDDGAVTTTTMTSAPQKGGVRYTTWMGLVAVDCASGKMMVGQWYDDELRSRLRAQLAALQPVELVLPKVLLGGGVVR